MMCVHLARRTVHHSALHHGHHHVADICDQPHLTSQARSQLARHRTCAGVRGPGPYQPSRKRARTVSAYPSPHTTRAWPSACENVQRSAPSLSAPTQRHTPYARPPPTAPAPAISCEDRARAEGLAGGGQPGKWAARAVAVRLSSDDPAKRA